MFTEAQLKKMRKEELITLILHNQLETVVGVNQLKPSKKQEFLVLPHDTASFDESYSIMAEGPEEALRQFESSYYDPYYANDREEVYVYSITLLGTGTIQKTFVYKPMISAV